MSASSQPSFRLRQRLGVGGMGVVHLAEMTTVSGTSLVALKRVRAALADDQTAAREFEREAGICALLRHENVVGLHAYGHDAEGPYLALELVDGCPASALVKDDRHLPLEAVCRVVLDVARGLEYARARGLIHRDVSADNVMVSREGVAKLGDFGIARLNGSTSSTAGHVKGKHGYIAPEVFEGQPLTAASDTFAFGVMCFRLLCGVPPFRGRTDAETMRAVLTASPPRPSQLRPDVPPELESFVLACLAKDPKARPATLEPLMALLSPQLDAVPGGGRPVVSQLVQAVRPAGSHAPQSPQTDETASVPKGRTVAFRPRARRTALVAAAGVAVLLALWGVSRSSSTQLGGSLVEPVPAAIPVRARSAVEPVPAPAPPPAAAQASAHPPAPARALVPTTTPRARSAPAVGRLRVKVRPWGHVFVNDVLRGQTPLEPFPVAAGTPLKLTVVNPELGARKELELKLRPGELRDVKIVFDAR